MGYQRIDSPASVLTATLATVWSVKDPRFGAAGDGVTDDTAAIQAAIDAAAAAAITGPGAGSKAGPTVYLPPGFYLVSSTLTLPADVNFLGAGPFATHLAWGGAVGGTVVNWTGGRSSFRGVRFTATSTSNEPAFNIVRTDLDYGNFIEDVFFSSLDGNGGDSAAVKVTAGVVNGFMRRVRFANCKYGVLVAQGANASGFRPLVIEDFTVDWSTGSGELFQSLIKVTMGNSVSNIGLSLVNGRVEGTAAQAASDASIVRVAEASAGELSLYPAQIYMRLVETIVGSGSIAGASIVHQETTTTTAACDVVIDVSVFEGIGTVQGGSWSTLSPVVNMPTGGRMRRFDLGRAQSGGTYTNHTQLPARVFIGNDDLYIERSAANTLALGDADNIAFGTTTGTKIGTGTTQKIGFYNSTPVAKQSVTGSRGGNAALADLLTKLATLGVITDSTSA